MKEEGKVGSVSRMELDMLHGTATRPSSHPLPSALCACVLDKDSYIHPHMALPMEDEEGVFRIGWFHSGMVHAK